MSEYRKDKKIKVTDYKNPKTYPSYSNFHFSTKSQTTMTQHFHKILFLTLFLQNPILSITPECRQGLISPSCQPVFIDHIQPFLTQVNNPSNDLSARIQIFKNFYNDNSKITAQSCMNTYFVCERDTFTAATQSTINDLKKVLQFLQKDPLDKLFNEASPSILVFLKASDNYFDNPDGKATIEFLESMKGMQDTETQWTLKWAFLTTSLKDHLQGVPNASQLIEL